MDYGHIQRQTSMNGVYLAKPAEWREDYPPLAVPCSLWDEPKQIPGPDLKFFYNDLISVSWGRDMFVILAHC